MCVGGIQSDGKCPDGLWERQFAFKPQLSTYTLSFGQSKFPQGIYSTYLSQSPFNVATSKDFVVQADLKLSSFIDSILQNNDPQFNDEVRLAFVNCPMKTMTLYAITAALNVTQTSNPGTVFVVSSVAIKVSGKLVEGAIAVPTFQARYSAMDASNKFDSPQYGKMTVDWTPRQGQEGYTYNFCFNVTHPVTHFSNIRCLGVKVVRCQYCTLQADTLLKVATKFHTNWLQLWSANSEPVFPIDSPSQFPLDISNLQPQTRITLGPTYVTKVFDDLPGIAARFQTTVDRLLEVNPDINAKVQAPMDRAGAPILPSLSIGQEVCVIPPICPQPP
mmetsp:Transcript_10251/g.34177  ORF Transcript_10251/g.34177 Transcript_10251/m.34177 type:complete len:332 (-) Transcript_10251:232-1227(-)